MCYYNSKQKKRLYYEHESNTINKCYHTHVCLFRVHSLIHSHTAIARVIALWFLDAISLDKWLKWFFLLASFVYAMMVTTATRMAQTRVRSIRMYRCIRLLFVICGTNRKKPSARWKNVISGNGYMCGINRKFVVFQKRYFFMYSIDKYNKHMLHHKITCDLISSNVKSLGRQIIHHNYQPSKNC